MEDGYDSNNQEWEGIIWAVFIALFLVLGMLPLY